MAFREKLELVVDVVTGNSSGGLSKLKTELGEADGAFAKVKVAGSSMWESIQANAAQYALAAGAALAGFAVKAVGDFQETALGAGKLRDSLGVTAEEASRLQEVAGDLGIGVDVLEKSIGRMNREAATSPGKFAEIGAAIAKNKDGTTNVTETFINVVEALKKIEDPTKRAAAAQEILGRSWQDAAELIELGADGVRAAMAGVEDAKIIDDKEVEQARKFRDTLDGLKGVMESISITVGGQLVPALTDSAAAVQSLVGPITRVKDAYEDFTDLPVLNQIYKNIAPWEQWRTRIDQVSTAFDAVTGQADEMEVTFNQAASEALYLAKQQDGIADVTDDLTGVFGGLIPKVEDATDAEQDQSVVLQNLKRRNEEAARSAKEHAAAVEELRQRMFDATAQTFDLERASLEMASSYARLEEQTLENVKVQNDAEVSDREKEQSSRDLRAAEIDLASQAYATAEAFADQAIKNGDARSKSDLMKQALGLQADAYPGLRDEIQQYINKLDAIPRSVVTTVTTRASTAAVASRIASGQTISGGISGSRAGGGDVDAGKSYFVGEGGRREVFTPNADGSITPIKDGSAGTPAAGATVNHITINTGADPNQVIEAIKKYNRRNGPGWMAS